MRRYLVAINTGGIAVIFAVAGKLAEFKIQVHWATLPILIFVGGLTTTGISLLLAKHKSIKRHEAEVEGVDPPSYGRRFWMWNFVYEIVALVIFVIGVVVALNSLQHIQIPSGKENIPTINE